MISARRIKSLVKSSAFSRYLCGRDDFVRHRAAAWLLGPGIGTALDVGGEGMMSKFRRDVRFTTVNIKAADVVAGAEMLPFRNRSFDAVVSLDTLEHISRDKRETAVSEMVRVARRKVVVAAPLGTREHVDFERRLLEVLERSGAGDTEYLAEHVRHGLPTPSEAEHIRRTFGAELRYEGDFRRAGGMATDNPLAALAKSALENIYCDVAGKRRLQKGFTRNTNRFYLVIELSPRI